MNTLIYISKKDILKTFYLLISLEIIFVLLYAIGNFYDFKYLVLGFDLDGEKNFTALFSCFQMLVLSFIYFSIYFMRETQKLKLFFLISGLIFMFLSFDEFFMIHERLSFYLRDNSQIITFKNGHGVWILPYLLFLAVIVVVLFSPLKRIWFMFKSEAKLIVVGVFIFIFGAVCLEIISYQYLRTIEFEGNYYFVEVMLEEFFEMIGISIILYSSLIIRMKLQLKNLKSIDYLSGKS